MDRFPAFDMVSEKKKLFFSFGILALGLSLSYGVFAQTSAPTQGGNNPSELAATGIVYPVSELGNCKDKEDCRRYCNRPSNMPACIAFSEDRGLVNKDEAARAKKFASSVLAGGGPGGCNSPESCRAFCSDIKNIKACLSFAEEYGAKGEHFEEAKKLRTYLESGGSLPGGCTSRESCELYCRDFDHAEECLVFAEKAKIGPASAPGQIGREERGPRPEEIRKFIELAKRNETPGGCASKESCELYCRDEKNFEECVAFGEKAGFIQKEDAERLKKTGGRGPGGCSSEEACYSYCNDPAHRQECIAFAEEHRVIPLDEVKEVKDTWVRLHQGFENAPPEIAECLKTAVGENIIQDIQSGKLSPGSAIGDRVRVCFERFGKKPDPAEAFRNIPENVRACLKERYADRFEKIQFGNAVLSPEDGDVLRACFESVRPGGSLPGAGVTPSSSRPTAVPLPVPLGRGIIAMNPALVACLKENLDPESFLKVERGYQISPEAVEVIKRCSLKMQEQPRVAPPQEVIPLPQPLPYPDRPVCIQVITPARDPATGACKEFPTPCNVPQGWYKVDRCYSAQDSSGSGSIGETAPLQPSYTYPTYPAPATDDAVICPDYESCKRVCTDASNPYFGSLKCTEFRNALIRPTSQLDSPLLRFLGAIFLPFSGFGK